jgi:hypothetical protein
MPVTVTLTFDTIDAAIAYLTGAKKDQPPGKRSGASPAPSPHTVVQPISDQPAAPEKSTAPTEPPPPTAPAADVPYADLQKAVLALHKRDPSATVAVAKSLGVKTFKELPAERWGEAKAAVEKAAAALDTELA